LKSAGLARLVTTPEFSLAVTNKKDALFLPYSMEKGCKKKWAETRLKRLPIFSGQYQKCFSELLTSVSTNRTHRSANALSPQIIKASQNFLPSQDNASFPHVKDLGCAGNHVIPGVQNKVSTSIFFY